MDRPLRREQDEPSARAPPAVPEWLEKVVAVLDEAVRVPGTRLTFGLDVLIGFLAPGIGDAATSLASIAFVWVGWRQGVPGVVLGRMVVNVAIDAIVGAIPVIGDLFDVVFRSHRRNLDLLRRHASDPRRAPRTSDYAVVVGAVTAIALIALLPLVLIGFLLAWVTRAAG